MLRLPSAIVIASRVEREDGKQDIGRSLYDGSSREGEREFWWLIDNGSQVTVTLCAPTFRNFFPRVSYDRRSPTTIFLTSTTRVITRTNLSAAETGETLVENFRENFTPSGISPVSSELLSIPNICFRVHSRSEVSEQLLYLFNESRPIKLYAIDTILTI